MGQGIRRTALMQARTEDPFEALMKTDAQRMARNQQSEESLLARDAKRGMFDEEMEMRGSQFDRKFAASRADAAAAQANAAARLGLARQAAARAAKGSSAPGFYEKLNARYKDDMRRKKSGLYGNKSKGSGKDFTTLGAAKDIKEMYNLDELSDAAKLGTAFQKAYNTSGNSGVLAAKNYMNEYAESDSWQPWGGAEIPTTVTDRFGLKNTTPDWL